MSTQSWTPPTPQELFDNAALGIIGQGMRAAYDKSAGTCCILLEDGRRCALGHSVTDAEIGHLGSSQWHSLDHGLGAALRIAHDAILAEYGDHVNDWRTRMAEIALEFGLDDSTLYFKVRK
jgi:hypothetical protein